MPHLSHVYSFCFVCDGFCDSGKFPCFCQCHALQMSNVQYNGNRKSDLHLISQNTIKSDCWYERKEKLIRHVCLWGLGGGW